MGGPGRAGASRREGDSVAACWGQCVPRPANPLVCASVCKDGHTPHLGDFTPSLFREVVTEVTPDDHRPRCHATRTSVHRRDRVSLPTS